MRLSARQWGVIGATAVALSGIAGWEGYRERSYDDGVGVQTVGFGTTRMPDGRPVQKGDRLDPVRAVIALQADADRHATETWIACLGDHERLDVKSTTAEHGADATEDAGLIVHVHTERVDVDDVGQRGGLFIGGGGDAVAHGITGVEFGTYGAALRRLLAILM